MSILTGVCVAKFYEVEITRKPNQSSFVYKSGMRGATAAAVVDIIDGEILFLFSILFPRRIYFLKILRIRG